jgi:hypothetical protein
MDPQDTPEVQEGIQKKLQRLESPEGYEAEQWKRFWEYIDQQAKEWDKAKEQEEGEAGCRVQPIAEGVSDQQPEMPCVRE